MHFEWLLFDLDNTLLDFSFASKIALESTFSQFNIPPSEENFALYKNVNQQVWDDYEQGTLAIHSLPMTRSSTFLQRAQTEHCDPADFNNFYLQRLSSENHYLPGVEETLKNCVRQGYPMAIVTNGLSYVQRRRWQKTNLQDYFQEIFIAEEVGKPKPNRYFFDVVHGKIGHPNRKKVLIIGDNPVSDIQGGREYGYKTCWVNRGNVLKHPKSDYTIESLPEIMQVLTTS